MWVVTVIGAAGVVLSLSRRGSLLRRGRTEDRADRIAERARHLLVYAFGQRKMFDDPYAGLYHALVFYGFLVVSVRTVTMVLEGLWAGWQLPLLDTTVGHVYLFSKDIFELLVLLGLGFAVYRRGVQRPARLVQSFGAWLVIGLIAILMITDLFSEGARIAAGMKASYLPISTICASTLSGLAPASLQHLYTGLWWVHLLTLLYFANELPYSKHFHVYTALFNVFFAKLDPPGKLATMDLDNIDEDTRFGISSVTDLTWKQMLDLYTCTECGRCRELCPTTLTNKPLEPVLFTKAVRDQLYREQAQVLADPDGSGRASEVELLPTIVDPETVWACTTCRWCERACPLDITYVDKLVDMRRNLVLEQAAFPEEAQSAFKGYEVNGNPWQLAAEDRVAWAEGLEVPLAGDGAEFEYLFFVGSPGSYDDHGRKVSQAVVKLLRAAGIRFAILGSEEVSSGDAPRRLGNEYLFQMLAMQNIETFERYNVHKIVTACPHVYNTLKHEYPDLGGSYQVVHATELVAELVRSGRIKLTGSLELDLAYHDPCYLGRTNGVFTAPRFLLNAIPGLHVREAELHHDRSMCCGAGGGRMWLEEKLGSRINQLRYEQLRASGTADVCVACPYCYAMLSDAQKELGDEQARTYDVLCLTADALTR